MRWYRVHTKKILWIAFESNYTTLPPPNHPKNDHKIWKENSELHPGWVSVKKAEKLLARNDRTFSYRKLLHLGSWLKGVGEKSIFFPTLFWNTFLLWILGEMPNVILIMFYCGVLHFKLEKYMKEIKKIAEGNRGVKELK